VAARALADSCLAALAVLGEDRPGALWVQVLALALIPRVVLAPVLGAACNGKPRHWLPAACMAVCFLSVGVFAGLKGPWLACWGLAALAGAICKPACDSLLPIAAESARVPLPRAWAWFELGSGAALFAGIALGSEWFSWVTVGDVPALGALAFAAYLVGLLAALPVGLATERRPQEPHPTPARGFWQEASRVWTHREARHALVLRAVFQGLGVVLVGLALAQAFREAPGAGSGLERGGPLSAVIRLAIWTSAGVVLGSVLAWMQGNPWRSRGLAVYGATGLFFGLGMVAWGQGFSGSLCLFLGTMVALVQGPLAAAYQGSVPPEARGHAMALGSLADGLVVAALGGLFYYLADQEVLTIAQLLWWAVLLATVFLALAWWWCFQESMEQLIEWLVWPLYRIRALGTGVEAFPLGGPVLVISNHSAWLDPVFIAKALPRRLTAMMTSMFYDKPVMRWFAKHVVHAIRVQASAYRREAPELAKAIKALDRGEAVLIFPEGAMRRRENLPLKLFGQGVWHILSERPQTPVVVCWIEGNWGCYFSYFNGPPTVNKRFDFWRRIDVAVERPQVIDAALLADHRETRKTLMRMCLEARRLLGLEPLRLDHRSMDEQMGAEAYRPGQEAPEKAAQEE
jgi:1-acyl-sn-glycerol-3-phosphate acyltransferase